MFVTDIVKARATWRARIDDLTEDAIRTLMDCVSHCVPIDESLTALDEIESTIPTGDGTLHSETLHHHGSIASARNRGADCSKKIRKRV